MVLLIVKRTEMFPDNWIYVHSPEVKVGRIQNFNNWGNGMVTEPGVTSLELEYFCNEGDELWCLNDVDMIALAKQEIQHLGLAAAAEILDGCVVRTEKAYPVYDANYRQNVSLIRQELVKLENLQVAGRNGMHKYNNQDHSMLTGKMAADNVNANNRHYDVWRVNTDAEYLEEEGKLPTQPNPIK